MKSNQNQVLQEIRNDIPQEAHLSDIVRIAHLLLMYQQDHPKIGQILYGFFDDQLKFNKLLKSEIQ